MDAEADAAGEIADFEGRGLVPWPGMRAMPMAPIEQAADLPDPVLAAPSSLQRDAAWTSVTDLGAAAERDGLTTVTRSWAWVATPFGAMAT
ncbi:MAG TPA: hypothetical protein VGI00_15015 [Streptosporangiaceae bacterium]